MLFNWTKRKNVFGNKKCERNLTCETGKAGEKNLGWPGIEPTINCLKDLYNWTLRHWRTYRYERQIFKSFVHTMNHVVQDSSYFEHWTVGWTASYPMIRTISSVTEQLRYSSLSTTYYLTAQVKYFLQFIFSSHSLQRLCVFGTDLFFSILV